MSNPYISFTWEDRYAEFPGRRKLISTADPTDIKQVYVERDEGEDDVSPYTPGTPFSAATLNNLEERINNAFAAVTKEVTGTLTAGDTSITLSDVAILTTSTIDVYTDVYGVSPETVTVATGSVTLTFEAQASDLGVKVRVMN